MRGRAQRPGPRGTDDFWTWRQAMYDLALSLDPERLYDVSRVAFDELFAAGVLTVGEFHYVHHQADGTPYDDRTVMADAVIRAAKDAGLRVALLRGVYHRGGPGVPAAHAQLRFSDASLDDALRDVDSLRARYRDDPDVTVGLAPHSVRALPPAWLAPIGHHARAHDLPLHMHVAEQPAEVDACVRETGRRPVELVADAGLLSPRFVAVHATHLAPHEARLLGDARAFVCLNPTTERDLGDGHPDVTAMRSAGCRLCTGIDSHVLTDPLEDLRGVELGERLRTLLRVTSRVEAPTLAERLWEAGSHEGARACGFADAGGYTLIDRGARELALVDDEHLQDAIVFSGTLRIIAGVVRAQRPA